MEVVSSLLSKNHLWLGRGGRCNHRSSWWPEEVPEPSVGTVNSSLSLCPSMKLGDSEQLSEPVASSSENGNITEVSHQPVSQLVLESSE